jgi:altronate hydrolase
MKKYIQINPKDNVAVALESSIKGTPFLINGKEIVLSQDLPSGHKFAIEPIHKGEPIIKYGYPIGRAQKDIACGDHIHVDNIKTNLGQVETYSYHKNINFVPDTHRNLNFNGYKRAYGKVGIRNELWIIPTVGCVNGIGEQILEAFKEEVKPLDIDYAGIFKHNYGCSQLGDDHENTKNILQNIVKHPNSGGVLVLGLGCENNQISVFKDTLGEYDVDRVKFLEIQKVGNEIEEGKNLLKQLYATMKEDKREPFDLSELKVGMKCGGSDGLSGITANPLVGRFSDFLISQGGTTMLTEVPEMFGAETILMERAENEEVFENIVHLINDFKAYFTKYDQPIYENPSPGNKAGGITTLEDKSLGCIQKGGSAAVADVLNYGQCLTKNGLNLLNGPGNDLVSTTALASSGCHMLLFTTGRGTPFGSFVPTVKISTNSDLYTRKPHWIDFNAGALLEDKNMEQLLEELIEYVIDVANGQWVNQEKNKSREIAIFKTGVTL